MKSQMPIENPFCVDEPMQEPRGFFGRQGMVADILGCIRRGQCVAVIGKHKIGKTSLLYQVSHPDVLIEWCPSPEDWVFVYIDGESLAHASRRDSFSYISERIDEKMEEKVREAFNSDRRFVNLQRTCRRIKHSGVRLVLVLDSLDSLGSNSQLGSLFFDPLRSLNAQYDVLYLTASERRLHELASGAADELGSPFFNIFKEFELGPLSQDESLEMLRSYCFCTCVEYPHDVLAIIAERAAGYPHHLQSLGWRLVELLRSRGWHWDEACYEEVLEELDGLTIS